MRGVTAELGGLAALDESVRAQAVDTRADRWRRIVGDTCPLSSATMISRDVAHP